MLQEQLKNLTSGIRQQMFGEAKTHLSSVRDLLRFAVSRFHEANLAFGHGTTNAYDEAAYLVLHTLYLPINTLEPFLDSKLTNTEMEIVLAILQQRIDKRMPAPYLTNEAWLGDFKFFVDNRVIVPRSFIAELLRERLSPWVADPFAVRNALDLCTGSGCLAVLMALAFPNAQVDASDISFEALKVAKKNVEDYGLEGQITLTQSDLFSSLDGKKYDLIISNPPYVNSKSMKALPTEYQHEPRMALASGVDGLTHLRQILSTAKNYLNDDGLLIVETGHNRAVVEEVFPKLQITWLNTSQGEDYVFMLHRDQLS